MTFDWIAFLRERSVLYVESGPNTKKGNVSIHCPFCGPADKSEHLGIDLATGYWGCWRNSTHRGRSPVYLVAKLAGLSLHQARELVFGDSSPAPDDFASLRPDRLWSKSVEAPVKPDLSEWAQFREIHDAWPTSNFYEYLYETRGFGRHTIELCGQYQLRCDVAGRFNGRIILPIFFEGVLVSWTSRAIGETSQLRYRDLEVANSIRPPKHCLFNFDGAASTGGHALVLVEGPIDTLKLDFFGQRRGVRAVGIFTRTLTEHQRYLLAELYQLFDRTYVMLDRDNSLSEVSSVQLCDSLRAFMPDVRSRDVPSGYKDAGEMSPRDVTSLAERLTR